MKLLPEKEEMSFFAIFKLLRFNIIKLLTWVIGITIVVIIYSFIMPNTYTAHSSVLPPSKEGQSGGLSSFIQSFAGGLSIPGVSQSDQSKLFGEILYSRTVVDYIIEKLSLRELPKFKDIPREDLQNFISRSIEVEVDKTGIIYVGAKYETDFFPSQADKQKAAEMSSGMVNYAVEGLDHVIKNRTMTNARKSREYIQSELIGYKSDLDSIATLIEKFQIENKVIAIDEQTQAIVTQAIEVGTLIVQAELELNLARLQYNTASPQVSFHENQLKLLKDQYSKIQYGGLTPTDAFSISLDKVPTLIKEYTELFRERKIMEQVIVYLETQKHQEAIQENRDVPVIEVLDLAIPAEKKTSPQRSLMVVLSLFLSGLFVTIAIVISAYRKGNLYLISNQD
ncbi:MAG: hypothetical protein CVV22_01675 [Ignavibacteriae bacterium HGW-Ignavibacteriae-1]|jgi:capsular polysaccharide biosynthesis protein|nr:MAG: hypothetical protein CVV22_01675 [Ignavibacteriae bacterium HGW-Ignavibacteriae-1]